MAYDVTFGGVALSSVAPLSYVMSFDVEGETADATSLAPPLRRGSIFVRARLKERLITVSIVLGGASAADRRAECVAIAAWAYSDAPKALTAAHMTGAHFDALCTSYPQFTGNDPGAKVTVEFTAFAPEYISDAEMTGASGTTLVIGGKLPTWVNLTAILSSQSTGLTWSLGGSSITLTGTIPAGTIQIDSEKGTIRHTNASNEVSSMMAMLSYDSRFWFLAPGSYFAAGPTATFRWRERQL